MTEPTTIRRRLVVRGHVQGVFFRDSVRERAQAAGVSGWARNREDGAVDLVLEGRSDTVPGVIDFCRRGHPERRSGRSRSTRRSPRG